MDDILEFVSFFLFDFFEVLFKKAFVDKKKIKIKIFWILVYVVLSLFLLMGTAYLIYLMIVKNQIWFAIFFGTLLLLFLFMVFAPVFQKRK